MSQTTTLEKTKQTLLARIAASDRPQEVLKDPRLKKLLQDIAKQPESDRAKFGAQVNRLKTELEAAIAVREASLEAQDATPLDVSAPWASGGSTPTVLPATKGNTHPLMSELSRMLDIYARMGFASVESRQIDDDFHMFGSLNFPEGHPARDDMDTFMTTEGLIAPAHTSTMQNRILGSNRHLLEAGYPIAYVIPGRVFRNEDVDARHEHTFHQLEGIYVDRNINVGNLIAVLQTFFEEYYEKKMEVKTQPFYFPFTEPSFEFVIACPFCNKAGCHICGEGWLEMLGCGMIHPNVLKMAGIDSSVYTGFAWGGGIERLVMIKHNVEDIRHFHSGKLEFLRQFV